MRSRSINRMPDLRGIRRLNKNIITRCSIFGVCVLLLISCGSLERIITKQPNRDMQYQKLLHGILPGKENAGEPGVSKNKKGIDRKIVKVLLNNTFSIDLSTNLSSVYSKEKVEFHWVMSHYPGHGLSCEFDLDNDGVVDRRISPCAKEGYFSHVFSHSGNFLPSVLVKESRVLLSRAHTNVNVHGNINVNIISPSIEANQKTKLKVLLSVDTEENLSEVVASIRSSRGDQNVNMTYSDHAICNPLDCKPGYIASIPLAGISAGEQLLRIIIKTDTGFLSYSNRQFFNTSPYSELAQKQLAQ